MFQCSSFEILPISALEKVRAQVRPTLFEEENTALCGERFCFQVAYRSIGKTLYDLHYETEGCEKEKIQVFSVQEVPCSYPVAENSDDYFLTKTPCMMPDVLAPVSTAGIVAKSGLWQSFFIVLDEVQPGIHLLKFSIFDREGGLLGETAYTLRVSKKRLPENELICSYWMHYDCLADRYGLPLFSKAYNEVLRSFVCSAVKHGLTMLLTPLFTPPLDTEPGKERMTVQLIDVEKRESGYTFGFERLRHFFAFAQDCGVKYFEMSHLFSQWGAKYAPKIVAKYKGEIRRIFGWDTEALSEDYKEFLSQFLPKLRQWLIENGYYELCYFHISDEPSAEAFGHYRECHAFVKQFLPDAKFTDALSEYKFYKEKLVDFPFVALDATDTFLQKKAKDYFVYYCTQQRDRFVSNRFLSLPLERVRVLGMQMYLNDVRGFLHWGYNYYYSFFSRKLIDPFAVTDCMGYFQSGDAFTVYPGDSGALESVRGEAFLAGIQDFCALRLLEKQIGRKKVCAFLEENGLCRNFTDYPKNVLWLIGLRKKINKMLDKQLIKDKAETNS